MNVALLVLGAGITITGAVLAAGLAGGLVVGGLFVVAAGVDLSR